MRESSISSDGTQGCVKLPRVDDDFTEQSVLGQGNRGWVEIMGRILEICQDGSLKTHVMYRCNLNSKQLAYYFQLLQDSELLEDIESASSRETIFQTTERGRRYVAAYRRLEGIFK